MKENMQITAYEVIEKPMTLQTAQRTRQWMDDTIDRFAYRCLPVAIANQMGWDVLCPVAFTAKWNGKEDLSAIQLKFHGQESSLIGSHFGNGVLTFTLGYLFRTTKSHNLWVKGPTNCPKDGISSVRSKTPFNRLYRLRWQVHCRRMIRFSSFEHNIFLISATPSNYVIPMN